MSRRPATSTKTPHRLELYERAVQQPVAEVEFIQRAARYHHGKVPATLREDFAGTASVAAAWVRSHPQREAIAVERHGPTLRWAQRRQRDLDGLHWVQSDVMAFCGPRVDALVSLNFSTFIWHDRAALLRYFRHVRRCLRDGGVFVMDAFGGPGAMKPGVQKRPADGFSYVWEQRAFNPVTARIDCRIHFELPGKPRIEGAFRYDWRLWTPAELIETLADAGMTRPTVWADDGKGRYRPTKTLPSDPAWVIYVTAGR